MASMRTTKNLVTGVIVTVICIACVLLIYHFTVGAKVSARSSAGWEGSYRAPTVTPTPPGAGTQHDSHAVPVADDEAVTKPASKKRPLPPETFAPGRPGN